MSSSGPPDATPAETAVPGRGIIGVAWASTALLAVVAIPNAFGLHAFDDATIAVSALLFAASLPVWCYAFVKAMVRTTRGDDVVVANLFFLSGSAPAAVRKQLLGATAVTTVIALATAFANPFVILTPMLPLGLTGMWGARYGIYPPRRARPAPQGGRR